MLEVFGLITVEPGMPAVGKGWCIARVKRTLWGDALLHLLAPSLLGMPFLVRLDSTIDVACGELQEILQPLFPAWRHNLKLPESAFHEGTYLFKASWGRVWRRIAVSGQDNWLAALAEAYGTVGQAEAGLSSAVEGLAITETKGERWYEAELLSAQRRTLTPTVIRKCR